MGLGVDLKKRIVAILGLGVFLFFAFNLPAGAGEKTVSLSIPVCA